MDPLSLTSLTETKDTEAKTTAEEYKY